MIRMLLVGYCMGIRSLIKAEASRYAKVDRMEWSVPETITRATQEYLDTPDDAAFGAATTVEPKTLSRSDPAARYTDTNGDRPFFAYSTNHLVDLDYCPKLAQTRQAGPKSDVKRKSKQLRPNAQGLSDSDFFNGIRALQTWNRGTFHNDYAVASKS